MSKPNSLFNYFKKVETPDNKKLNIATPESKKLRNENKENADISMQDEVRLNEKKNMKIK